MAIQHMPVVEKRKVPTTDCVLVYTDGASRGNRGPAAIGYSVFDEMGTLLSRKAKYIGKTTNNVAEYKALIWAMDEATSFCRGCAKFHSDSELVVNQVNGCYAVKKDHLKECLREIEVRRKLYKSFELVYVPRENERISMVDALVNEELDKQGF